MFIKRKRLEDKAEDDRQQILLYKQVFGSAEGRVVLMDLMNRYRVLNPCKGELEEGGRRVVLDIMARANMNMVEFDNLLKGAI